MQLDALLAPVLVAAAYAVGCLPTAARVGARLGFDPLAQGSGNPGATNALRLGGRRAGLSVLAGDLLKGFVPVGVTSWVAGDAVAAAAAAAAVLGHLAPMQRGFRGGKGVATTAGAALALAPWATVAAAAVFVVVAAGVRMVSAASVAAAIALPVAAELHGAASSTVLVLGVLALAVVARHRGNLDRIRSGTEPRLGGAVTSEEPACSVRSARR